MLIHTLPQQEAQQEICLHCANSISSTQQAENKMRELTEVSEIVTFPVEDDSAAEFNASSLTHALDPSRRQIFPGNANDVPTPVAGHSEWDSSTNNSARGLGLHFCIECDGITPFPSNAHVHAAEEHLARLKKRWQDHRLREKAEKRTRRSGTARYPTARHRRRTLSSTFPSSAASRTLSTASLPSSRGSRCSCVPLNLLRWASFANAGTVM